MEPQDPQQPSKPDIPNEHLFKAIRHFFDAFCEDNDVPADRRLNVSPVAFLDWMLHATEGESPAVFASVHGVTTDTASFVLTLAGRADAVNRVMGFWPFVVVGDRPQVHEVESVVLLLNIAWADGVVVPVAMTAHRDKVDGKLKDAEVASLITRYTPAIVNNLLSTGLDVLHDYSQEQRGFNDPALLDKVEGVLTRGERYEMTPDEAKRMGLLMHYIRTIFAVPSTLRATDPTPESSAPRGGWAGGAAG